MDLELMSLDELFKEAKGVIRAAKAEEAAEAKKPRRIALGEPKRAPENRRYDWPENWNRGQNIALIHKDSSTIVGVFSEWLHKTEAGVRKLMPEEGDLPIHAVEELSGGWAPATEVRSAPSEIRVQIVTLTAELSIPHVSAAVALSVESQGAGILSARLLEPVVFGGATGLLQLPASTNILPVMTRESKINLRQELNL